ncbi:hypothetical protein HY449_01870 [Candidatus Pacearchaeota archaeon]|nr:hypothetical protein [Candidatus Pacearchaeota archaeon]
MKRGLNVLVLVAFLLAFQIVPVSADPSFSPSSFSISPGQNSSFTITITNPDTYADTGLATNITRVNITLPSSVVFVSGTESTDSASAFSATANVLSWDNSSYVIGSSTGGDNVKTFSFVANATTLGILAIVVRTMNSTTTTTKNISLTVSDSVAPQVTLVSPENNNEDADGVLVFSCNATDNLALNSMKLAIYFNDSETYGNSISVNGTASNQSSWDYTFNSNGEYKWNCFANDTAGNSAWASNRTIKIDALSLSAQACASNWTCANWSVCSNGTQTRTCTDANSCGNVTGKPAETQTCTPPCASSWKCADWTPAKCPKDGKQTRTCTDANACGDLSGKPSESLTCEYKSSIGIFVAAGIILALIAGSVGAFFYLRKNKVDELYPQSTENANQNYPQNQGYNFEYS